MRTSIVFALILVAALASCGSPDDPTGQVTAATVQMGDTVAVDYVGRLENGTVFDSSEGREPLEFQVGTGAVIPGFENAVLGMDVNETKTITIPPSEAYGEYNESLIQRTTVPIEGFGVDPTNMTGELIQVAAPNGQTLRATVIGVENESVVLDVNLNHPLAGQTLVFDITVRDVEDDSQ